MHRIARVDALPGYRLAIAFSDGLVGRVCIAEKLIGPMFEPLKDKERFVEVRLDEFGTVCWPNGADLAPDELYRIVWESKFCNEAPFDPK